jgi:hypothetical protein
MVVDDFEKGKGSAVCDHDITTSGTLAVAMEFLGLLDDSLYKKYASTRGGVVYSYFDKKTEGAVTLSARELLHFLPDD